MPRELTFDYKKKEYTTIPVKIDRKKLYGWTEIHAIDEKGRECKLVTTDQTGTLIIPKGGTALGIISSNGEWVDRSELITVKNDGSQAELFPSSYETVINLKDTISEEEFLDYSITDFYQLTDIPEELIKKIGDSIYTFGYSYLDSYEETPAFLLVSQGSLFMMLGYKNKIEMLCLGDCGIIDEDNDDYIDISDDDIDFSMF